MTSIDELRLTDDEIVGVAIAAGVVWPGRLPTVNDSDGTELQRAAARGWRSLAVRDLAGDGKGRTAVTHRLAPALSHLVLARAFLGTAAAEQLPASGHTTLYDAGADVLLEVVSPFGVHLFREMSRSAARQELLKAAKQPPPDGAAFVVVGTDLRVLMTRSDDVTVADSPTGTPRSVKSAAAGLDFVLPALAGY